MNIKDRFLNETNFCKECRIKCNEIEECQFYKKFKNDILNSVNYIDNRVKFVQIWT